MKVDGELQTLEFPKQSYLLIFINQVVDTSETVENPADHQGMGPLIQLLN